MQKKVLKIRVLNDLDTFNKMLEESDEHLVRRFVRPPNFKSFYQVTDKERWFEITTSYGPEKGVCTYRIDKELRDAGHTNPGICYKTLLYYGKIRDIVKEEPNLFEYTEDGKIVQSAKPMLDSIDYKFDIGYEGEVYGYDINSAYGNVLRGKVPDTFNMRKNDVLKENEVGFILNDNLDMVTRVGGYADVVFPLIDSPYIKFINKFYRLKREAKERELAATTEEERKTAKEEKRRAKDFLNFAVGCAQNHNPFFRAFVVHSCNKIIKNIIKQHKDDVVYWNTDSVYSKVELKELELGDDIGQWKLEYQGLFRLKGINYQKVDKKEVCYRGVVKEAFSADYNLLTDKLPKYKSSIYYDVEKNQLIRR